MIRITCTSCKTVLNIDDAFAGGVCRCQHCGTIQTVPTRQKASATKTTVVAKSSKTLFSNKARVGGAPGSGLEDLADIVASSGLSDKRLRKSDKPEKTDKPAEQANKKLPLLLAAAAGVIVALLIVVIILIVHNMGGKSTDATNSQSPNAQSPNGQSPGSTDNPGNNPDGNNLPPNPATAGPNFCGVALNKDPVVYLIDNGSSSTKDLDFMKNAVYKSAESLGINRNFEILFWNVESRSFPTNDQTAPAVAANIEPARKQLDDVDALGLTEPTQALARALKVNPGEIVLITAKSGALDETLPAAIMTIRGTSTTKIDCIAINGVALDPVLSDIASKTGGTYANISEAQLRAASY